jgi:hypothetical protein
MGLTLSLGDINTETWSSRLETYGATKVAPTQKNRNSLNEKEAPLLNTYMFTKEQKLYSYISTKPEATDMLARA